jgi:glycosyltransferase involved in cell wall biosynthesis
MGCSGGKLRVLAFIPSLRNTSPGSRFRIEQWARLLEHDGIHIDFVSFEDESLHRVIYQPGRYARKAYHMLHALVRRVIQVASLRQYDVVFVYEEVARLGPPIFEWLIHRLGKPIVYDFCDPIWIPYVSPVNKYLSYLKWFSKYARICRYSSQVIVGNDYLAEFARQHNPNVTVIPITIDTEDYRPRPSADAGPGPVTVGWSGSVTTVSHLETIRGALRRLRERVPFELRVIGSAPPNLEGIPFAFTPWNREHEVHDLWRFDIGIMPLPADPWTRYRGQLKVRQYMGVGIPSVASPVGILPDIIQDGVNGFLATTEADWVEKLTLLIEDSGLRRQMGAAAYQTAQDRFSARVWAPRLRAVLEAAAGASTRSTP